ncbi:hypothetical protein TS71_04465 [Mycolicibacterium neoaurum]|uniref:Uncharacterized protein n=1 Tax=Mycolicibacterium neoaurum VKM Ac-1815D TaxID=700508 RepID=V5XIY7_MYCNE|nr:hypothetical protein D174_06340 [Mycolicibacterium neoaurum VKM Ac-1815D]AMO04841.1 hypothetical protein MyAD_06210 [Mycolicibacterium neoaurum]AXK76853.1 hypothetical protein DXK33_18900 [Mycolicibacterium neoaurum]KJQ51946.1 hypothetical protein TS71_04465 [Mycolicibacterium neoaurum]
MVFGQSAVRSAPAATVYKVIVGCIGALSVALILSGLASARRNYLGPILVLLAPWAALSGAYVVQGGRNNELLLYPVVAIAFALNWNSSRVVYRTLRVLIIVTALSSLVLGASQSGLFLSDPTRMVANEKALFGGLLLNGLFPTSNQLGLALALGIPILMVTIKSRYWRWTSVAFVLAALVWTSARTSILISVVVIAVLVMSGSRMRQALTIGRLATVLAGFLVVVVPFVFTDPTAFTNRAWIWQCALRFAFDDVTTMLFGGGAMIFREASPVTYAVGAIAGTGHNVFVTIVTIGGMAALVAVAILWIFYLRAASKLFEVDRLPLIFLLTVTGLSVIEDPLRAFTIGPQAFIFIPLLAMPLAAAYEAQIAESSRHVNSLKSSTVQKATG